MFYRIRYFKKASSISARSKAVWFCKLNIVSTTSKNISETTKILVSVNIKNRLEFTIVVFIKEKVFFFDKIAEIIFVCFVQIVFCNLYYYCIALEYIDQNNNNFVFEESRVL